MKQSTATNLQQWESSIQRTIQSISDYQDLCKFFNDKNYEVMDLLKRCRLHATPQLRLQIRDTQIEIEYIVECLNNSNDAFVKIMQEMGFLKQCRVEFENILKSLRASDDLQGSRIAIEGAIKRKAFSAIVLPKYENQIQEKSQAKNNYALTTLTENQVPSQKAEQLIEKSLRSSSMGKLITHKKGSIVDSHNNKKQELQKYKAHKYNPHSLRNEVIKSTQRYQFTKAGRGLESVLGLRLKSNNSTSNNSQVENNSGNQSPLSLMRQYDAKRSRMEKIIEEGISRPNRFEVSFEKKYDRLGEYFQTKKQLVELYSGETLLKNLKQNWRQNVVVNNEVSEENTYSPLSPTQNNHHQHGGAASAFLTDLTIKTRAIKPGIRRKIDEVIQDVKTQLVDHFHQTRTNKFNELNTDQLIELVPIRKAKKTGPAAHNSIVRRASSASSTVSSKDSRYRYQGLRNSNNLDLWETADKKDAMSRMSTAYQTKRTAFYNRLIPSETQETYGELADKIQKFTFI